MKKIQCLVDMIDEELEGAKEYTEMYLDYKAKSDSTWANRFREMANDELKHATYIHELTVAEIELLQRAFTPPVEMEEKWEKAHKVYIEKTAWIKQMLGM